MTSQARLARDFEVPLVRWWLRQRFLLLGTVFLLLLALAVTLLGALWITRVKEEVPATILAWQPDRTHLVLGVAASSRDRFAPGRPVELLVRDSPQAGETTWRGEVLEVGAPTPGAAPAEVDLSLRMSPRQTTARPASVRLYVRARRAIEVVRERDPR